MTRVIRLVAVAIALVLAALPSVAQTPTKRASTATTAAADSALAKRVSLDLKAMAPGDAFKVIADAIGYQVAVASDVTTPVDIVVRNITAKTALNTICESIGCRWEASGSTIRVRDDGSFGVKIGLITPGGPAARKFSYSLFLTRFEQKLPADMRFENTPFPEVAERLSKATGFEITIDSEAQAGQTFSADLGNRSFSAALKTLGEQLNGNVVCRVSVPKEGSATEFMTIAIHVGKAVKKVRK